MPPIRAGFAAALAVFLAASARPLPAVAAELELDAGAGCIDGDDLQFQVERALGQPLAGVSSARFLVHVQPAKPGFRAELEISEGPGATPRGFRSLAATACAELTQQVALAIALALGGHASSEPTEAPSPAASPPPTAAVDETPAAEASGGASGPDTGGSGPALAGSAWVIGDTGTLPSMGWGLGAGLELGWPGFELRALGTLLPEREGTVDASDASSPGAEIGLLAGGVLACLPVALHESALALSACAGGELGALSGDGTGVSTPYHQRTLWAAARFDVVARWALPQTALAIEALVTAAAPLTRDEFVLKDIGSVHRPEGVLGRAALGVRLFID
jgi:hypothetical protein